LTFDIKKKTDVKTTMKKMKTGSIKILPAVCCLLLSAQLFATQPTADFLRINNSAGASAIAGAYAGHTGTIDSIYSNPAGLIGIKGDQMSVTGVSYIQDTRSGAVAYVTSVGKNVFGVSVLYFGLSGVEVWVVDNTGLNGTPDPSGRKAGVNNFAPGISWARQFGKLGVGATLKDIAQNYDDVSSNGLAADVGAVYKLENLSVGLSILNIGPAIDGQKLPSTLRCGAAYMIPDNPLDLSLEIEKPLYANLKFKAGAEYDVIKKLALRCGYEYMKGAGMMSGVSGGLGFKTNVPKSIFSDEKSVILLDYAFTYFGDLGNIHKVSLGLNF
jgi:hypothetical protein